MIGFYFTYKEMIEWLESYFNWPTYAERVENKDTLVD